MPTKRTGAKDKQVTAECIFTDGDILDSWACDVNPVTGEVESNGGTESLVYYKKNYYTVLTGWDGTAYSFQKIEVDGELPDFIKKSITLHRLTQGVVEL